MDSPYLFLVFAGIGAWLLRRGVRGIQKKVVRSWDGQDLGLRQPRYYLAVVAYLLGGSLSLAIGAMLLYEQKGAWAVAGLLAGWLGVILLSLYFRKMARALLLWVKSWFIPRPKPPGPSPRLWALAAAALLSQIRGRDHETLAGGKEGPTQAKRAQRRLSHEWEIDDEEEFQEVAGWLFDTGHRTEFHAYIQQVVGFDEEAAEQYTRDFSASQTDPVEREEELHRLRMAREDRGAIREKGFMAWDLIRYLDLMREGYLAGYTGEAEAWDALLAAAQVLQSRYDSWSELGDSFLLAREFWSVVETRKDGNAYRKTYERLLRDKKSPWHRVKWELPLYVRK